MEKDQLISMIHFLVKREDEPTNETRAESNSFELCLVRRRQSIAQRAQENQEQTNEREKSQVYLNFSERGGCGQSQLKDMVKELRDTHKQDVKTQTNLMKSIDNLTSQVADLTTQNRMISERIAELAQALPSRD